LLAAIPVLGLVQDHLAVIPGSVPDLINLPAGCKFAPRCPYVKEMCIQQVPELVQIEEGHSARCHMRHPATAAKWAGVGRAEWQFIGDEVLVETVR